jgi:hypothetical protein
LLLVLLIIIGAAPPAVDSACASLSAFDFSNSPSEFGPKFQSLKTDSHTPDYDGVS